MPSFCAQCGTALKPDAQFCEECGAPTGSTAVEPSPDSSARRSRRGIGLWSVVGGGVLLLIAGGLLFALQGWFDPDKRANQLFVEASQLVHAAQEAEQTSYTEAFDLYQAAQRNLDKITSRYPSSQVAVQLTSGQAKIGVSTLAEFQETVRQAKARAEAESDPLACILFVAMTLENTSRAFVLTSMASKYAEIGQKAQAVPLLSHTLQATNAITKADPKASALPYIYIAEGYAKAGDYEHALQLTHTITDTDTKARALHGIAEAYIEAKQKAKALELLSDALQLTHTITDVRSKAWVLSDIAEGYAKAGDYEYALQLTHTITDTGGKAVTLRDIAEAYAKAGDYDRALQVANTITEIGYKAEALGGIAQAYAKAGGHDRALQLTYTITDTNIKAWALRGIAGAYAKAGDYDQALQLTHTITEAHKASTLGDIAQTYIEAGQRAKALELLSDALQAAHAQVGISKASTLDRIAEAYAKAGDYDRALQVVTTMEDADRKVRAWVEIIYTQTQDEQKENSDTKRILHDIIRASTALSGPEAQARLKPEVAILGEWQNSEETVEFFKDGTVNFRRDGRSLMGGDYKVIDDSHVRMSFGGWLVGPTMWKFSVSRDQLTFTLPDGKLGSYRRVK